MVYMCVERKPPPGLLFPWLSGETCNELQYWILQIQIDEVDIFFKKIHDSFFSFVTEIFLKEHR